MSWVGQCCRLLLTGLLTGLSVVSFAGDIQVLCAPDLRVYLDGELAGTSNTKQDGLFLMDVKKGKHTVRIEKDGFLPRSYRVRVVDLPIEVKVEELIKAPQPSAVEESHAPEASASPDPGESTEIVGSLLVTSAPQNCVVEIDGTAQTKNAPQLSIGGLAVGVHTISFSKPGFDRLTGVVEVQPAAAVTVRGNLLTGKVEMVHDGKGSLRLITKPTNCKVLFLGKLREKSDLRLNLSFVPAGEHRLVVSWNGLVRSSTVLISRGQRTVVNVNFLRGDEPFAVSYEPQ